MTVHSVLLISATLRPQMEHRENVGGYSQQWLSEVECILKADIAIC